MDRKADQEGLPPLQHHRRHAGRRLWRLAQALKRRYERVRAGEAQAPDVLLIDGGLGQINEVHVELEQLGFGDLKLVGVAKGPDRKPGQERLFVFGSQTPIVPGPDSRALRVIQRIRDEATSPPSPVTASAARAGTTNPCWKPSRDSGPRSDARCCGTSAACRD